MTELHARRARLTRRGAVQLGLAVLLYAAGFNAGAGWVIVLAAVLGGAVLAGYATVWWAARRVRARRDVPALAVAGEPLPVTVEVRAPGAVCVRVVDGLGGLTGAGTAPLRLAGQVVAARGGIEVAGLRVVLADRFGLARAGAAGTVPSPVLVVSPFPDDSEFGLHLVGGGVQDGARRAAAGAEFGGLRPYAPGDSPRSVSWRASARHSRLLVGEPVSPTTTALRIAIGGGTWQRGELDRAVERAAALAAAAAAGGRAVEVAADGRVSPWSDATRRDLALLPPHWGAPPRPLAPPPSTPIETLELTRRA